ncbi:hypothetical protein EUGRSUZ_A02979 [Eucalyptus grandis]|uniref:Uncharacterized protein n=2 Tax=Eucalyptus grandis TaxID=71139 RepID=A0ACC3M8C7_EUCGR|nr:hypothetical protein EUGRSUZ_A02979 [Eucalyptus grandis]
MSGLVSYETEVKARAAKVWELYGPTKMALLAKEALPDTITGLNILEGQGAVGTIIKITLAGDMGLSLYRLQLEVMGKDEEESCVIKSTIEYEVTDEASVDVSLISVKLFADIAKVIKKRLTTSTGAN